MEIKYGMEYRMNQTDLSEVKFIRLDLHSKEQGGGYRWK